MEPTMLSRSAAWTAVPCVLLVSALCAASCGGKKPPVARPTMPPPTTANARPAPPSPPEPVAEPTIVPPEPVRDDAIASASLDDINRNSPLKPLFFEYDSSEITPDGRTVLDANAALLKKYSTWAITIEGHCDER